MANSRLDTQGVKYYNILIQAATEAPDDETADIAAETVVKQQAVVLQHLAQVGGVDPKFKRIAKAMLQGLEDTDDESDEEDDEANWQNPDGDSDEDEEEDELAGDAEDGCDVDMVPVRSHERRHPVALVNTVTVSDLSPFSAIEPFWPTNLIAVFQSRNIRPEHMEGLQHLLLDLFSRSRAQGAAILAAQWRNSKRHSDAWRVAIVAPASTDDPFPNFTRQMITCLKSEAAEGLAQIFNLIEHVGLASKMTRALRVLQDRQSAAYSAYLTWYNQRGRRSGRRGSYESLRKFIIVQAVNAVFSEQAAPAKADNLKLVSTMVRRAEVLVALEHAFGAGVFVLLLGFDWKSRTDKAWNNATSEILRALADDCPMLGRVCRVADNNIWSRIINNQPLNDAQLNVEVWNERDRANKDLLTLLSYVDQEITENEDTEMEGEL